MKESRHGETSMYEFVEVEKKPGSKLEELIRLHTETEAAADDITCMNVFFLKLGVV